MHTKAHSLIQAVSVAVVSHDVKERRFVALHLAAYQLDHESTRQPPALKLGMRTYPADLTERTGIHALTGHGDQALTFEAAEVLTEFDGPRAERAWAGQDGQRERLRGVLRTWCSV